MSDIGGMDVDTIIQRAGGVSKLAALLAVRHPTICDWKRTGFLPGGRVIEISEKLGLDVEQVSKLIKPATPRQRSMAAEAA